MTKASFHLLSVHWGWNLSGIQELRNPSAMLVSSCLARKLNFQELNSKLLSKSYKDHGQPVGENKNHRNTLEIFSFFSTLGSFPSGTGNLCAPCLNPSLFSSDSILSYAELSTVLHYTKSCTNPESQLHD